MSDLQKPNVDQASQGNMAGVSDQFLRNFIRNELDDMMPARVVSYNAATNRAVIKPLIMIGTTDGAKVSRAELPNIPVFRFGGGDLFIAFPIKAGDFGWLKASDRDYSLMMQAGGGEDWPNTERMHSFSDSMFFPDALKGWTLADNNALVLQTLDGISAVTIKTGQVKLASGPSSITITPAGVAIVSPTMTHNGKNIGATHTHNGVTTGTGTTGVPT